MSETNPGSAALPTLVVGATGGLGGKVVKALLARNKPVRALVREGSDATALTALGVEVVRGDMVDPASLGRAMAGAGALVTSAAGYMKRRKTDSLAAVDDVGNRNLVDAAKEAKLGRFVFTSILACDKAPDVPHFWQKKRIEDYLEASGVPFVSLRPGAFLAMPGFDMWAKDLEKNRITNIAPGTWTSIHIDDVATCLALAVDEPRAVGRRIDLGMDRPFSGKEAAEVFSKLLGRPIAVRQPPWFLVKGAARVAGLFNETAHDMGAMFEFFTTGQYIADTTVQAELFPPVPTVEATFRRYLEVNGLLPAKPG